MGYLEAWQMCGMVHIGRKPLAAQEVAEKLNNIGLDAGDSSDSMHIFNFEFPFEGSIRCSFQEITEAEAI